MASVEAEPDVMMPPGAAPRALGRAAGSPGLLAPLCAIASDAVAYALAGGLLAAAAGVGAQQSRALILVAVAVLSAFWSQGLYPGYMLHAHERIRRRVRASFAVGAAVALFGPLLGMSMPLPLLAAFLVAGLLAQPFVARLVVGLAWRAGLWGERARIIGTGPEAAQVVQFLERNWGYGLEPVTDGPAAVALLTRHVPLPDELAALRRQFRRVVLLADLPTVRLSGLQPADLDGALGLNLAVQERQVPAALYRLADLVITVPLIILSLPVILVAAIAIRIVDPGPAFFWQQRDGLHGRPFALLKLRTMYQDAGKRLATLLENDPAAREEWATHFKLRHDPRVLPVVGHLLRSTSIDELPQLFNVLAGQMRIVGPRPFPDYHLAALEQGFRLRRCHVMPGLTGLWQISVRSDGDLALVQMIDDFYIANRSPWFDLHILMSTALTVLFRRGAY